MRLKNLFGMRFKNFKSYNLNWTKKSKKRGSREKDERGGKKIRHDWRKEKEERGSEEIERKRSERKNRENEESGLEERRRR